MTAVINLSSLAPTVGTCPAISSLFHDRNSRVGMIDNRPIAIKIESLGDKCVTVEIIVRALLEKEYPQRPDDEQCAGGDAGHQVGDLQPARRG
jgi:hypothetical protein